MTRLVVDFGSTHTVAVHGTPSRQLLFDGTPLLPSNVFAHPSGLLYTGADAARLGRTAPERLEPSPKQRIDDGVVLLGDREWPVTELVAAVFARVAQEAIRVAGLLPPVVLTHPAAWGAPRRELLRQAAERAGMTVAALVAEPIAAAAAFARQGRFSEQLAVFDFGGGTVDIAIVRGGTQGAAPAVLASEGLADLGGADIDAAVARFLAAQAGHDPEKFDAATRLEHFAQARAAKESLSRTTFAEIHAPGLPVTHLTREQLDAVMTPLLRPAVMLTQRTIAAAAPHGVALFLVGGASRTPLVATMLHAALGTAPIVLEQPELAVAEGAALLYEQPPTATAQAPPPAQPSQASPVPPDNRRRGVSRRALVFAAVGVLAAAAALVAWRPWAGGIANPAHIAAPAGSSAASAPASPSSSRPQWPVGNQQSMIDVNVHYQVWSTA